MMKPKQLATLLLLQASALSNALVEPNAEKIGTVAEREFVDPAVSAVSSPVSIAMASLPALMGVANMDVPQVDNPFGPSGTSINDGLGLGSASQSGKKISVDARSGIPAFVDLVKPIMPGDGVGNSLTWSVGALHLRLHDDDPHGPPQTHKEIQDIALVAVENWFHENDGYLGIDSRSQLFQQGRTRMAVHGSTGEMVQLSAQRTFKGLAVKGSRATATIKKGNLINIGLEQWGEIDEDFDVEPSITADEAIEAVADHAGREVIEGKLDCKSELVILSMVKGLQDATTTTTTSTKIPKVKNDFFSKLRGQLPARVGSDAEDEAETEDEAFGSENNKQDSSAVNEYYDYMLVWKVCPVFVGQQQEMMEAYVNAHTSQVYSFVDTVDYFNNARGSVYPTSNDGEGADGSLQADWPMPYMYVGSQTTTTGGNYEGPGSMTATYRGPYVDMVDNCGTDSLTQSGGINWGGSGGTDCTTPGFGGAGNTHSSRSGFYELNKIMEIARSRLPNNSWLQGRLRSNMNINNSCNAYWNGSINFYREGNGCGNTGEIAAIFDHEWGHGMDRYDVTSGIADPSGEGIADLYSALRLNDSCIGRGFYLSRKCSGCISCTGVRDIDYMKKSGSPFTHSNAKSSCGSSVHCIGVVYSEAVWDLYKRHLQSPPYNYDDNTAMEIVTRMTYIGAGNVANWFSLNGTPGSSGCFSNSGYHAYLAADDDDGNLNNGTPHMNAIFTAFNEHQIACPTSYDVKDSGCPNNPNSPPIVIQVISSDAQVTLTWASVNNAVKYEVLRTEGVHQCAQGKVLLGEVSASDQLTWTDTGLQNGREYYYIIVPKGQSDSCYGPSSSCIAAIPSEGPYLMSCPNDSVVFNLKYTTSPNTRQCTIEASSGWSGTVNFACSTSGTFSGVSCTVPSSIYLSGNSALLDLTIAAGTSATEGDGTVTLTATGGGYSTIFSTDVLAGNYGIAQMASYSNGSPMCATYGASCDSGTLLDGRGTRGPEENQPNTRDGVDCDGDSGTYHSDESLDRLVVRSLNGDDMIEGTTVEIEATVWAWSTGSSDTLDLYYSNSNDMSNPNWQHIVSKTPSGGGQQIITAQYQLPEGLNHVIRGNFRYSGSRSYCSRGSWDDADDLAFVVRPLALDTDSPTGSPTASPSESRVPSSEPSLHPSLTPSTSPSRQRSALPSTKPSSEPSLTPSISPSKKPSLKPSTEPSLNPSLNPSMKPSSSPSSSPTLPTSRPSVSPSTSPSQSVEPSFEPSDSPSSSPSTMPSLLPSSTPSLAPSLQPSANPTFWPSYLPSLRPSESPTSSKNPTRVPTTSPTKNPTSFPTTAPTRFPTNSPTKSPVQSCALKNEPCVKKDDCCKRKCDKKKKICKK